MSVDGCAFSAAKVMLSPLPASIKRLTIITTSYVVVSTGRPAFTKRSPRQTEVRTRTSPSTRGQAMSLITVVVITRLMSRGGRASVAKMPT